MITFFLGAKKLKNGPLASNLMYLANKGYTLWSSVEYNWPKYSSLISFLPVFSFSSTKSIDECISYWICSSSSGFNEATYLGAF